MDLEHSAPCFMCSTILQREHPIRMHQFVIVCMDRFGTRIHATVPCACIHARMCAYADAHIVLYAYTGALTFQQLSSPFVSHPVIPMVTGKPARVVLCLAARLYCVVLVYTVMYVYKTRMQICDVCFHVYVCTTASKL
jgi:hypothetical protein